MVALILVAVSTGFIGLGGLYLALRFNVLRGRAYRGECMVCGYSTLGNESLRCPECGNDLCRDQSRHSGPFGRPMRLIISFALALLLATSFASMLTLLSAFLA